jgi:hypothetical protein
MGALTGCRRVKNKYQMQPGTALKELDPYTGEKVIIEVGQDICDMAEYKHLIRWIAGGHNVAEFDVDGTTFMQSISGDVNVAEKGRRKRKRAPRRDAPGVAPEAAGLIEEKRPRRKREKHYDPL